MTSHIKHIEFTEYINAIIYAWCFVGDFIQGLGKLQKSNLQLMKKPWPNFIKQSTQQRGKRRKEEREREDPSTKPNPKWFVWFVLQLARVECVLFMIDQSLVRFMHNYQVLCSLLSMSADVGRKLQSCREEHKNAWTLTSSPKTLPPCPKKGETHAIQ